MKTLCSILFIVMCCSGCQNAIQPEKQIRKNSHWFKRVQFDFPDSVTKVVRDEAAEVSNDKSINQYLIVALGRIDTVEEYIVSRGFDKEFLEKNPCLFFDMIDSVYVFLYTGIERFVKMEEASPLPSEIQKEFISYKDADFMYDAGLYQKHLIYDRKNNRVLKKTLYMGTNSYFNSITDKQRDIKNSPPKIIYEQNSIQDGGR